MAREDRTVQVGFPFAVTRHGRIADPGYEAHVREMIELVLFTSPGERVNRPEFGCGLLEMIFGPESEAVASAAEYLVQGALKQWLGEVITVRDVDVTPREATLTVRITYQLVGEEELTTATFERETPWQP